MLHVKLQQPSPTPLEQPSVDPADVLACFRRIKRGPTLSKLQQRQRRMERHMGRYDRSRERINAELTASRSHEDFKRLERLQGDVNRLKIRMVDVSDQIGNFKACKDSSATELQAIRDLPQVLRVRAETPETIMVTAYASIIYNASEYLLGLWDIYFGRLTDIKRDNIPLIEGVGDMPHFRVRRIDSDWIDSPGTLYYNYDDGSFCFGVNADIVNSHAKAREYLHTLQLMLTYLSWIGGSARDRIPEKFTILEEGKLQL